MLHRLRTLRNVPMPVRLLVTGAAVGVVCAFQLPLEPDVPGDPFLLFFVVVIATAFAFGEHVGFAAVGFTSLLAFLFFEPFGTLAIRHAGDLVRIELYAVLAAISALIVGSIGRAFVDAAGAQTDARGSIFLRELTHRVANNFAVIAALISRKAGSITDAQARSVLDEAIEQVTVMARLHRHLQVDGDVVSVDSKRFIGELCQDLQTFMARDRPITIEHTGISCVLAVAQAVPLGLIINELVTNALKHAFPGNRRGTVRVRLDQPTPKDLLLVVEDDGVGVRGQSLPTGMGRGVVDALAVQLGGQLECRSHDGRTTFSLSVPFTPVGSVSRLDAIGAAAAKLP
jgi:two-component sensor histidine kinase